MVGEAFDQVKSLQQQSSVESLAPVFNAMRSRSKGGGIVAGMIMILIGGLFGGIGGYFGFKSIHFELQGKQTEGQVIRMIGGGGNSKGSKPVVAYTVEGKPYEIEGSISSSPPAYKTGEKATVYYDPNNPGDAQIGGFVERWLFPTIFGGIGGLVFVVGLSIFFGAILRRLFRPLATATDLENARFSVE
ncbi:MAG: DUF3592 domain-containing protein [Pirellulales bacterium]